MSSKDNCPPHGPSSHAHNKDGISLEITSFHEQEPTGNDPVQGQSSSAASDNSRQTERLETTKSEAGKPRVTWEKEQEGSSPGGRASTGPAHQEEEEKGGKEKEKEEGEGDRISSPHRSDSCEEPKGPKRMDGPGESSSTLVDDPPKKPSQVERRLSSPLQVTALSAEKMNTSTAFRAVSPGQSTPKPCTSHQPMPPVD
ncbi:uncharacterized protein LOC143282407 [Babylonia areolata]|uniref:uncharacterized protein LOC143282407 n=1 Tax=Babylonia areolata TaxID=304850 RepID=UPI003FD43829